MIWKQWRQITFQTLNFISVISFLHVARNGVLPCWKCVLCSTSITGVSPFASRTRVKEKTSRPGRASEKKSRQRRVLNSNKITVPFSKLFRKFPLLWISTHIAPWPRLNRNFVKCAPPHLRGYKLHSNFPLHGPCPTYTNQTGLMQRRPILKHKIPPWKFFMNTCN